jgi:hypothetical protein
MQHCIFHFFHLGCIAATALHYLHCMRQTERNWNRYDLSVQSVTCCLPIFKTIYQPACCSILYWRTLTFCSICSAAMVDGLHTFIPHYSHYIAGTLPSHWLLHCGWRNITHCITWLNNNVNRYWHAGVPSVTLIPSVSITEVSACLFCFVVFFRITYGQSQFHSSLNFIRLTAHRSLVPGF